MKSTTSRGMTAVLTSVPLIASLILLVANDWYFKAAYGNWSTGKLSDFAGIFLLSLIAFAALPKRRKPVAMGICVAFSLWKSPAAEPLITLVNAWGPSGFGRVVDYTDLMALVTVPLAWRLVARAEGRTLRMHALRRALALPVLVLCCGSMVATSYVTTVERKFDIKSNQRTQEIDTSAVTAAICSVAADFELTCHPDDEETLSGVCTGGGMTFEYDVERNGAVTVRASATKGGSGFGYGHKSELKKKLRRLKKALRQAVRDTLEDRGRE